MAKALEQTIKKCKKCGKKTTHQRSYNKTSLIMWLVHIMLTVITGGIWLVLLLVWMLLNKKIGGWTCAECGK
jgi:hypothetical protein